jgi:dihydroorotate dehydrogenase
MMIRQALHSIRKVTVRTVVGGAVTLGVVEYTTHLPSQGKSSALYHQVSDTVLTPLMRTYLDPEVAHSLALELTQRGLAPRHRPSSLEQRLDVKSVLAIPMDGETNSSSLVFPNPIGLAAGFDKDGQAIQALLDMGFGSVEIGTVTPQPQPGNPKPRMFRLADDLGIINRYGFNSKGADIVENNLRAFRQAQAQATQQNSTTNNKQQQHQQSMLLSLFYTLFPPPKPAQGLLGINIGKNKITEDAKIDYVHNILQLGPYADYLVINISSPNTPNLRDLQKPEALRELVQACLDARTQLELLNNNNNNDNQGKNKNKKPVPPLFVKLSPDLTPEELESMIPVLRQVDGVVVTNTTNQRPDELISKQHVHEIGGLSGAPIKDKSTEMIRSLYKAMDGNVFIVGVGGVGSGEDAYEKLKAGASVVQIYSMMVYQGPGCVSKIRHDLAVIMEERGHKSLEDVVGRDHEEIFWKKQLERRETLRAAAQEATIVEE